MILKCLIKGKILENRWKMAVLGDSGVSAAVSFQLDIVQTYDFSYQMRTLELL